MKKLMIIMAMVLFAAQFANAQTEKGTQTIGADLGFSYLKYNDFNINPYDQSTSTQNNKTTGFNIGPAYSYFIANGLDIGTSLSYNYSSLSNNDNTYTDVQKKVDREFGGQLFLRKYFMYTNKIGIRTGAYIGYYRDNEKINYSGTSAIYDTDSKTNTYTAGAKLEVVYYPSKHIGVSTALAGLSYSHGKTNTTNQGNSSNDDVNFDFINDGLSFSVFYVFGGK